MKIDSNIPAPKERKKVPKKVDEAINEYKEEYKKLYGVNILAIEWKGGYIYIEGQAGISLRIFRSRIQTLKFRNG